MDDHPLDAELRALREKRLKALQAEATAPPAAPDAPVKITDASFAQAIAEHETVLVDIWAPWCGPCRMIAPTLDELAHDLQGEVVIAKLNADENPRVPSQFNVTGIPTLLLFKKGQLVDRIVGVLPKDKLRARLTAQA